MHQHAGLNALRSYGDIRHHYIHASEQPKRFLFRLRAPFH